MKRLLISIIIFTFCGFIIADEPNKSTDVSIDAQAKLLRDEVTLLRIENQKLKTSIDACQTAYKADVQLQQQSNFRASKLQDDIKEVESKYSCTLDADYLCKKVVEEKKK